MATCGPTSDTSKTWGYCEFSLKYDTRRLRIGWGQYNKKLKDIAGYSTYKNAIPGLKLYQKFGGTVSADTLEVPIYYAWVDRGLGGMPTDWSKVTSALATNTEWQTYRIDVPYDRDERDKIWAKLATSLPVAANDIALMGTFNAIKITAPPMKIDSTALQLLDTKVADILKDTALKKLEDSVVEAKGSATFWGIAGLLAGGYLLYRFLR